MPAQTDVELLSAASICPKAYAALGTTRPDLLVRLKVVWQLMPWGEHFDAQLDADGNMDIKLRSR